MKIIIPTNDIRMTEIAHLAIESIVMRALILTNDIRHDRMKIIFTSK